MEYCRNCGKPTDNRKMMIYCECGGKLINERQYKLEQNNKCNHLIGLHKIKTNVCIPIHLFDGKEFIESVNIEFKYCPLCGNKTRFYTKETNG